MPSLPARAAIAANSKRAGPRAQLWDSTASNRAALISPSNHGPSSANLRASVLERPRPVAASSTMTRPRRTSCSRASRYRLLLSPARAAAAAEPGHARFSRSAKLTSENATKRSPAERSSRARAAAMACRLTARPRPEQCDPWLQPPTRIAAGPRQRLSHALVDPSTASLDCALVPPRTQSLRCWFDPPHLLSQLARGSKPLRGEFPAATVVRAAEAPTVRNSTASAHLLGVSVLRGGATQP